MKFVKSLVALSLVLVLLVTGVPLTQVSAASSTKYDYRTDYHYKVVSKKKKTCKIVDVGESNCKGDVVIPSKIDGYEVVAIDKDAFMRGSPESVTIPSSVKKIGEGAFGLRFSLKKVVLSEGLEYIGKDAFESCAIKSIVLPETLEYIGSGAFAGTELESIVIPSRVKKIYERTFEECEKLEKITFNEGLTHIADKAFIFSGLTSVEFPKTLESIGEAAFAYCENLTSVDMKNVSTVGDEAFEGCGVTSVVWSENLKTIPAHMFYENKIESLELPDSVEVICEDAFVFCPIKSVDFPDSLRIIEEGAFSCCDLKGTLVIPGSIQELDLEGVFTGNKNIEGLVLEEGVQTLLWDYASAFPNIKMVSFPDSVKSANLSTLGYKGQIHCNSGTYAAKTFKKSLRHAFKNVVIEPTCAEGYTLHTCECGYSYKDEIIEAVEEHDIVDVPITPATKEAAGSTASSYCSKCNEIFVHSKEIPQIGSIKFLDSTLTYNGKVKKPTVCVRDTKGRVIDSSNYSVSIPSSKNIGTYTCTITFKGDYSGKISLKYKIVPKGTTLSQFNRYSGAMKVYWNAQKTNTSGYQIQYAKKKDFSDGKIAWVKSNKTTNRTIKKLSNAKYYFRVRTYKSIKKNGKTERYYSSWSLASPVYVTNKATSDIYNHWEKTWDAVENVNNTYQDAYYDSVFVYAIINEYRDFKVQKIDIYRATSKKGTYKKIKTVKGSDFYMEDDGIGGLRFMDTKVKPDKTYYYKMKVLFVPEFYKSSMGFGELKPEKIIYDSISPVGTYHTAKEPIGYSTKGPQLKWKKVSGAVGYMVRESVTEFEGYNIFGESVYVSVSYHYYSKKTSCESKLYPGVYYKGTTVISYEIYPIKKINGYYYCESEEVRKKVPSGRGYTCRRFAV